VPLAVHPPLIDASLRTGSLDGPVMLRAALRSAFCMEGGRSPPRRTRSGYLSDHDFLRHLVGDASTLEQCHRRTPLIVCISSLEGSAEGDMFCRRVDAGVKDGASAEPVECWGGIDLGLGDLVGLFSHRDHRELNCE